MKAVLPPPGFEDKIDDLVEEAKREFYEPKKKKFKLIHRDNGGEFGVMRRIMATYPRYELVEDHFQMSPKDLQPGDLVVDERLVALDAILNENF